jgi:hypothetical protein
MANNFFDHALFAPSYPTYIPPRKIPMSRRHRDWVDWSDDLDESGAIPALPRDEKQDNSYVDSYRVPQDAEIVTLRAIIENEQQLVERLTGDIVRANASVEAAKKDVEDLARQLTAAQSALHFATASRDNIVKDQKKYITRIGQMHGVLHPLRRTPTELLGYIFTLAVQESVIDWEIKTSKSDYPRHGGQDPTLLAWRFSQVCRRWRNAALDTPRMWRHLHLDLRRAAHRISLRLTTLVRRSGAVPLDVYMQYANPQNVGAFSVLWAEHILNLGKKWRRLSIDFDSVVQGDDGVGLLYPLPQVEEIHLVGRGQHMHLPNKLIPVVSSAARITSRNILLHHIDPSGPTHIPFRAKYINLMLGSMQTLSTMDVAHILETCPVLEQLELIASKGGVTPGVDSPVFAHQALTHIAFHAVHISSALRPIQRNISLPALRQVTLLSAPLIPSAALIDGFKQFVGHNPSIRKIQFNKVANLDREAEDTTRLSGLREILGALSSLVHLVLVGDSSSAVIRALLHAFGGGGGSKAGVLLPSLETIVIAKWTEAASTQTLAEFCARRRDFARLDGMDVDRAERGEVTGVAGRNTITVSIRDCPLMVKTVFRQFDQTFLAAAHVPGFAAASISS